MKWHKLLSREGLDAVTVSGIGKIYRELHKNFGTSPKDDFFVVYHGKQNKKMTIYTSADELEIGRNIYKKHFYSINQIVHHYNRGLLLMHEIETASSSTDRGLLDSFHICKEQFDEVNRGYSILPWWAIESWQYDYDKLLTRLIEKNALVEETTKITNTAYKSWKKTAIVELQEEISQEIDPEKLVEKYQFLRSMSMVWHNPIDTKWIETIAADTHKMTEIYTQDELLRILSPDKEEKKFFEIAPYVVFFKDWRDEVRRFHAYSWLPLFERISDHFGVELEDLGYLTLHEVENTLRKDTLDTSLVKHRKNVEFVIQADENGVVTAIDVSTEHKEIIEIVKDIETKKQDISGTVAQKGVVQGPVVVVNSYEDTQRVTEGCILVANTTHPNYLPAMKKAAAFVTNEGGTISHAAIVAREMKKPCIVGTRIATHVLNEGDIVKVDANEGVVKKL